MAVGIFESIVINGFAAFMPKILETILSTTPTIASYMSCKEKIYAIVDGWDEE